MQKVSAVITHETISKYFSFYLHKLKSTKMKTSTLNLILLALVFFGLSCSNVPKEMQQTQMLAGKWKLVAMTASDSVKQANLSCGDISKDCIIQNVYIGETYEFFNNGTLKEQLSEKSLKMGNTITKSPTGYTIVAENNKQYIMWKEKNNELTKSEILLLDKETLCWRNKAGFTLTLERVL